MHSHARTCTCREHPYADSLRVKDARDAYLAENGFTVAAYEDKYTKASVLGIPLLVPNTKKHQWAIMLHDLHHVATGFGTDMLGEAEVSAWETRGGVRPLGLYVGSIVVSLTLGGMLLAPFRTAKAFRAATGRASLFGRRDDYEDLMNMTVGELRACLGVPSGGLVMGGRELHSKAPRSSQPSEPAVAAPHVARPASEV